MKSKKNHLWGGRFNEPTDKFVKIFGASVTFDKVLALYDIEGSIAHATMLCEVNVLTSAELNQILEGLDKVKDEVVNDQFS
ncbi:lyase family protein, partial [Candidatus Thioglobus sp.]|nr:lyase family protein [Candidatus Thioglobus sp.]